LELLQNLYGGISVPREVFKEIEYGKSKDFYVDLSKIDWIKIEKIKNFNLLSEFIDLDKGEAETIILAKETKADLIIID